MASWVWTYAPRIVKGSGTLDLSANGYTPLTVCDEGFVTRLRTTEVPLMNGAVVFDARRGPATVSFQGVMHIDPDLYTKEDILTRKDDLHTYLIGGTGTPEKFSFYRYYDASTGNHRWYKDCYCQDLQFHWTSRTKVHLPYSFTILVPDGIEWEVHPNDPNAGHDPDDPFVDIGLLGPRVIQLDDDAGASAFSVVNSSGQIVFKVDSAGNVLYTGYLEQVDSIAPVS